MLPLRVMLPLLPDTVAAAARRKAAPASTCAGFAAAAAACAPPTSPPSLAWASTWNRFASRVAHQQQVAKADHRGEKVIKIVCNAPG
jgi:hypothetical protein